MTVTLGSPESLTLARWLSGQLDVVATQATAAIWEEVPSYRESGLFADVVDHCRSIFNVFVVTILEDRLPTAADFPFTARHAAKRVAHGIALSDFLQAYRIAQIVLWQHVIARVHGDSAAEANALELVSQVMRTIEAGSSAAAATYLEAQQYAVADQEQVRRDCLEQLLIGVDPVNPAHRGALASAGLREDVPFVVISAVLGAADGAPQEIESAERATLRRLVGGLVVTWQGQLVGVVPTGSTTSADVVAGLRGFVAQPGPGRPLKVGVSTIHRGIAGVGEALRESELARADIGPAGGIVPLADLSPLDYLLRRPDETVRRIIKPEVWDFLTEDAAADGTYAATLTAYIEHGLNAREAAKSLFVHPNTMYLRLEKIAALTGQDVRQLPRLIDLWLAAKLVARQAD